MTLNERLQWTQKDIHIERVPVIIREDLLEKAQPVLEEAIARLNTSKKCGGE